MNSKMNNKTDNIKKDPKIMPNNFEAEQSLLGAIMIDNSVGNDTLSELKPKDFYFSAHSIIFEIMRELQATGKPIDIVTLSDKLELSNNMDKIGGIGYLTELTNILPSSANYKYYLDIVKRNGMLRLIIKSSSDIIENSYSSDNSDEALAYAEKMIFDITDTTMNKDLVHLNESVNIVMEKFQQTVLNPNGTRGLLTHFDNLDRLTNGYLGGQMIVLAARPGVGKTSFAMNVVTNIATNNPEKVIACFNLEMSTTELTQRILLSTAQVSHESVVSGATPDEFKRLWEAKKKLDKSNIYIDDTTGTTPEQIMSKCRRLKQLKKRLDFVVIDYLQLLTSQNKRSSIQQEVSDISRSIKILAKELKVPVMILSQMSRDLEKRPDKTPKLSDLRDSGAIEQDADQVYFLMKDEKQEGNPFEIVDLAILKHRSGACGTVKFKWEGNMVKFTPASYDEAKSYSKEQMESLSAVDKTKVEKRVEPEKDERPEGVIVENESTFIPPNEDLQEIEGSSYFDNMSDDMTKIDTKTADNTNWSEKYDK